MSSKPGSLSESKMGAESKKRAARSDDGDAILATVVVPVPPDRVFRALNRDEVKLWRGFADMYCMTACTADHRVDGRWSFTLRLANDNTPPTGGDFLEIDATRKFAFTRKYEWDYPVLGRRETTVAYLPRHYRDSYARCRSVR